MKNESNVVLKKEKENKVAKKENEKENDTKLVKHSTKKVKREEDSIQDDHLRVIETNMTSTTKVKREEDSIQDLRLIESNLTIAELPLKEGK